LAIVLLLIALATALRFGFLPRPDQDPPEVLPEETTYVVQRVVDGDTLRLPGRIYVRLIGVDTPETVKPNWPVEPFGPEATQFTKEFIGRQPIQLRLDHERTDQHGRWLAYVYVNGKMLNEALLKAGLATAHTEYHYSESMKKRFREAEAAARKKRLGIWSLKP
jgi:micrococcal nuclease